MDFCESSGSYSCKSVALRCIHVHKIEMLEELGTCKNACIQ